MPKLEFSDMNTAADYRKITLPSLRAVLRMIEARRRLDEVLRRSPSSPKLLLTNRKQAEMERLL